MCFENVKEMSEKFASISPPLPSPFLLHVKHQPPNFEKDP